MNINRTPAVVLSFTDYGESDKIVTFYSPFLGRFTGIAKGAKRSKKRFVNKLEIFSWLDVMLSRKGRGSLVIITEAELQRSFNSLRSDYDRYTAATLIAELMLLWTRENDADENLFALLLWALNSLNRGGRPARVAVLFQIRLLSLMGYHPHLDGCMQCGCFDATGSPFSFHLHHGGLLCRKCKGASQSIQKPLSLSTAKMLRSAQLLPPDKLDRLRFTTVSLQESLSLLKYYGQHLLQREIHSADFVKA
jgi:DNA repair protein RecO (recombination protein O)